MGQLNQVPKGRTALSAALAAAMVFGAVHTKGGHAPVEPPNLGLVRGDGRPLERPRLVVSAPSNRIDDIRAVAGVDDAIAIGDGFVAVVTDLTPEAFAEATGLAAERDALASFGGIGHGLADPYAYLQWGLYNAGQTVAGTTGTIDADTDAPAAFAAGIDGNGVVVAVIDSGIDMDHPDLIGSFWINDDEICGNGIDDDANGYVDDCRGWDFGANDDTPDDPGQHYHGTHVASIIGARHDHVGIGGIAPGARIMNLKVAHGATFNTTAAAAAIRYAVDNGAKVVNASWGTPTPSAPLQSAINYAEEHGVVVVAAAGNDGANLNVSPRYPAAFLNTNVIAVGSSTPDDALAPSSNFGSAIVDIAAPGTNIVGAMPDGQYAFLSGTSMAAPHVAAASALVLSRHTVTPAQLRSLLMTSADRPPALSGRVGAGRLNVASVLGLADPDEEVPPGGAGGPSSSGARFDFAGFVGAIDGQPLDASITFTPPIAPVPGPYRVEATLVSIDGTVAVVQHLPIHSNGAVVATDEVGAWNLLEVADPSAPEGAIEVPLRLALPEGRYGIVVNLVDAGDPELLYDDAQFVVFDVGPAPEADESDEGSDPVLTPAPDDSDGHSPTTTWQYATTTTIHSPGLPGPSHGDGSDPTTTAPRQAPPTTRRPSGSMPGGGESGGDGSGRDDQPLPGGIGTATTVATPRSTTSSTVAATTSTLPIHTPTTSRGGSGMPTDDDDNTGWAPTLPPFTPVSSGEWSVTAITPNTCRVNSRCEVTITGTFPSAPNVWFGNQVVAAASVSHSPTMLQVTAPARASNGIVAVRLRTTGLDLVVPNAFAYFTPGQNLPTPGSTPTTLPVQSFDPGTTTTIDAAPPTGHVITPSTVATTTTTIPQLTTRRRTLPTPGGSFNRNGLTVAVLEGSNPLGEGDPARAVCRAASCSGKRVVGG